MVEQRHPDGYAWRSARRGDGGLIADLAQAWEEMVELDWRSSADDVEHDLADQRLDLERDTLLALDDAGRAVAGVMLHDRRRAGVKRRVFVFAMARPGHEALADHVIDWGTRRARAKLDATPTDAEERVIRTFAPVTATAWIERLRGLGYQPARYFVAMLRDLQTAIPDPDPPRGVRLVDWNLLIDETVRLAHLEAFADHWGSLPPDAGDWRHRHAENPHFLPEASVVAIAGDDVIGYSMNHEDPSQIELTGRRTGEIATLGVRPRWRRRGVASTLLVESLHRLRGAGYEDAVLGVDSENESGAMGLYERVGFREQMRTADFVLSVV